MDKLANQGADEEGEHGVARVHRGPGLEDRGGGEEGALGQNSDDQEEGRAVDSGAGGRRDRLRSGLIKGI